MADIRTIIRIGLAATLALAAGCQVDAGNVLDVDPTSDAGKDAGADRPRDANGPSVDQPIVVCLPADAPRMPPDKPCTCDSDCTTGTCRVGVCCAGDACGGKLAPGNACTKADQCQSGYCVDGVCCNVACSGACVSCSEPDNMGQCVPVDEGRDDPHGLCRRDSEDTCGQSGQCNGEGGCAKHVAGTICKLSACAGKESLIPASVCDGEGSCIAGVAIACDPSTCDGNSCRQTCTVDSECLPPNGCKANSCGKFGPGQDCASNEQCKSNFCVDGVCCNNACTGSCQTCASPTMRGTCSPVLSGQVDPRHVCVDQGPASCGTNGKCNGTGACQSYANGTVCRAASCNATANNETPAGTCATGKCNIPAVRTCAPFRGCSGTACTTSCGSDSQCVAPNVCTAGNCGKRPNGALCNVAGDCMSNVCAQGRCCAGPCTATCKSCAVRGQEGTCANVALGGADPTGACRDDACSNNCNGNGACARESNGSACGAAVCGANNARTTLTCNATGTCQTITATCAAGLVCTGGNCAPPIKQPNGGNCVNGTDCASNNCVAGRCCANACTGLCRACTAASSWTCANRTGTCGAGGSCMVGVCCGAGLTNCGGVCTNLTSDEGHCGACTGAGSICGAGLTCVNGACTLVCAPPTPDKCGNACFDLSSDTAHCGACTTVCGAGEICQRGVCACPAGRDRCGGPTCLPLNTIQRCGSCTTSCEDNNPCTADSCGAAGCVHTPITGTSCSNGNACDGAETCRAGVCAPGTPVVCAASDQCHNAGTCNPATGTCSNPVKTGACNDGNACTTGETCNTAGVCAGGIAKTCPATDQCHNPGVCAPATGVCSNPVRIGTCNDGNACTTGEACTAAGLCAGGTTRTCAAPGVCHTAGTCNPATGVCSDPIAANGTRCGDLNACNGADTCQMGVCTAGTAVVCPAPAVCHTQGTCNPLTGMCTTPNATNGTACGDGNACNGNETCQAGVCSAGTPLTCTDNNDPCKTASCAPAACGGTASTCRAGTCVAGSVGGCDDDNPCTTDTCNGGGMCVHTPDNSANCGDGNACNGAETCQGGSCRAGTAVNCTSDDLCLNPGTCNPNTGTCSDAVPKCPGQLCVLGVCTPIMTDPPVATPAQ
jgi:hypothetical protein